MLSHIKDLFRHRKQRQQRRFFSDNHPNRNAQPVMETAKLTVIDMPFRKDNVRQRKQQQQPQKKAKNMSTDNMTIVAMPEEGEPEKSTAHAADELANLLVEADNKRRSQLPCCPGLEQFKMIRKLGEYEAIQ
jgi:hypothetical protein